MVLRERHEEAQPALVAAARRQLRQVRRVAVGLMHKAAERRVELRRHRRRAQLPPPPCASLGRRCGWRGGLGRVRLKEAARVLCDEREAVTSATLRLVGGRRVHVQIGPCAER